jgi:hypothetical protein
METVELCDRAQYDPTDWHAYVVGCPESAIRDWRWQDGAGSCAIEVQAWIIQSLTGRSVTEAELLAEAAARGWYRPETGTEPTDVGKLLELYGIAVGRATGCTLAELEARLAAGARVIVGVDADEIWWRRLDGLDEDLVADPPGLEGRDANHAVEVIGVDRSRPGQPLVILNDPGHPRGRGMIVSAAEFLDAWEDSNCFLVYTRR